MKNLKVDLTLSLTMKVYLHLCLQQITISEQWIRELQQL